MYRGGGEGGGGDISREGGSTLTELHKGEVGGGVEGDIRVEAEETEEEEEEVEEVIGEGGEEIGGEIEGGEVEEEAEDTTYQGEDEGRGRRGRSRDWCRYLSSLPQPLAPYTTVIVVSGECGKPEALDQAAG